MEWFESKGAGIFYPIGHSPHADFGDRLARVQVKTCTYWANNRWCVTLATRGGNRSWSGLVKRLDPSRCDYVFVVVGDGRRWCLPAAAVKGGTGVQLGGPKYADFEVEPTRPLPSRAGDEPASTIVPLDARGDVRVAKGDGL